MAISLYDATVASYLQGLGAVSGFLERGLEQDSGTDPAELVEARIHPDMLPLRFQLISVAHHSLGAIEGVKAGLFQPPPRATGLSYTDLQGLVANAHAALAAMQPGEVEALQGRDMVFKVGERTMPFVAEDFLLSFSVPNFYFHATTAYDILRQQGIPLGKRDFMGQLRLKS